MLEYGAHPGDNNQPIFSPNSLSLLLPGSFPVVSSEISSQGCVSSLGFGVALPHRNVIWLQPFIYKLESFQEEGSIPGSLLARPGSPASSQLPRCPACASRVPQNSERSHASQAGAPLERTNPPLLSPVLCQLGLTPATSPTASDPCSYSPPASHRARAGVGGEAELHPLPAAVMLAQMGLCSVSPCPTGNAAGGHCATPCHPSKGLPKASAAPRAQGSYPNIGGGHPCGLEGMMQCLEGQDRWDLL